MSLISINQPGKLHTLPSRIHPVCLLWKLQWLLRLSKTFDLQVFLTSFMFRCQAPSGFNPSSFPLWDYPRISSSSYTFQGYLSIAQIKGRQINIEFSPTSLIHHEYFHLRITHVNYSAESLPLIKCDIILKSKN